MKRAFITIGLTSLLAACSSGGTPVSLDTTHVHGLAVDQSNSNRLYLATHDGLYVFTNDKHLTLVGRSRDDFMGFSPHPTDATILFSSGHPVGGGNIGFQKSTDGGESWEKISNGNPRGPADFHAMMVHLANPNHIYGWYKLRIHRSLDQGKTWAVLPNQPPEVLSFAGDPQNENIIYLGTIGELLMSTDRAETFVSIAPELKTDIVFDIEILTPGSLILSTRDHGIVKAMRGENGEWNLETMGTFPEEDPAYYLALDPKNSQILYAFTKAHSLNKSLDGGKTWLRIL